MKFIIGKKISMTQKFLPNGNTVAVTELSVSPCAVTQIKTRKKDGYSALQLGCGDKKRVSKPLQGHLHGKKFSHLHEFRIQEGEEGNFHVDDIITVSNFHAGDIVKASGLSKGMGFQGVVKRHGFKGQPSTHGHKDQSRMPGASGAGGKQHVFPGKRMPGRMGGNQVTMKNLEVIETDEKKAIIFIKGAVPGSRNSIVYLEGEGDMKAEKAQKPAEPEIQQEEKGEKKNEEKAQE